MFNNTINDLNLMRVLFIIYLIFCCNFKIVAQGSNNNKLEKNINVLAENLVQNLTVSRDSLVLKNDKLFSKVHFYKDNFEKTFYFKPAVTEGKISLQELPLGSYSVMFYQTDKIIVFRVNRNSKFENTIESVAGSELTTDISLTADLPPLNTDLASTDGGPVLFDDGQNRKQAVRKRTNLDDKNKNKKFSSATVNKNLILTEDGMYPYDLSNTKRDHVQTREDYRNTHLRPNGKPYD